MPYSQVSQDWRCFLFHAYFPFPTPSSRLVDYSAFKRAVTLLVSNGALHLGEDAIGAAMYPEVDDAEVRAFRTLWRMFRSFTVRVPCIDGSELAESKQDVRSEAEDLLEILSLVQPADTCLQTVRHKSLQPHSSRISNSSDVYVYTTSPYEDLCSVETMILITGTITLNDQNTDDAPTSITLDAYLPTPWDL